MLSPWHSNWKFYGWHHIIIWQYLDSIKYCFLVSQIVRFYQKQKQHIINILKLKYSKDGSDLKSGSEVTEIHLMFNNYSYFEEYSINLVSIFSKLKESVINWLKVKRRKKSHVLDTVQLKKSPSSFNMTEICLFQVQIKRSQITKNWSDNYVFQVWLIIVYFKNTVSMQELFGAQKLLLDKKILFWFLIPEENINHCMVLTATWCFHWKRFRSTSAISI